MANQNTGRGRLARHGMTVTVGLDTYLGLGRNVEYEITWAQRERLTDLSYDQGTPRAATYLGDIRKGRLRLGFRYASNHAAATSLIAIFGGDDGSDAQNVEDIVLTIVESLGSSAGETLTFSNCELAADPVQRPGSGSEGDMIYFEFEHDSGEPAAAAIP